MSEKQVSCWRGLWFLRSVLEEVALLGLLRLGKQSGPRRMLKDLLDAVVRLGGALHVLVSADLLRHGVPLERVEREPWQGMIDTKTKQQGKKKLVKHEDKVK